MPDTKAQNTSPSLQSLYQKRYHRRSFLKTLGIAGLTAAFAPYLKPVAAETSLAASARRLTFAEIAKSTAQTHNIAEGYHVELLIRWGDRVMPDAPAFDPLHQTKEAQLKQFGYNNDFLAYMPFPLDSQNSNHGLLCVNHEYASTYMMFPNMPFDANMWQNTSKEQVDVEIASHGHCVIEVRRLKDRWETVVGSPYNRRLTPFTSAMELTGPVKDSPRIRTKEDPNGTQIMGTLGNCAGGVTPWGSVLVSEENFDGYFIGETANPAENRHHARYGVGLKRWYGWGRFYDRFNVAKEPNEPNRYGWVVEYDPYDPARKPVKHSWLGRFKHETATVTLAPDGRVVIYSGDDERFEYLYRYVSNKRYNPQNRAANFDILKDGMLYVARFQEDGSLQWLPLTFGQNGLTPENGFHSQADVLIESRRAGDILGATPMDRPEGIALQPVSQHLFVSMTYNELREKTDTVNRRSYNRHGHIVELSPPQGNHAADVFQWRLFAEAGNPANAEHHAMYLTPPSPHGWFSCPDNLACDNQGNLWVCTDGQPASINKNDSLYAMETEGAFEGQPRLFFNGPHGCEVTGLCFTPDNRTAFLSIQHPGDDEFNRQTTFETPFSRWPDFDPAMPPRPSVITITRDDNGVIGS